MRLRRRDPDRARQRRPRRYDERDHRDPWAPHRRYEREHFRDDFSDQGYWEHDSPKNRKGRY